MFDATTCLQTKQPLINRRSVRMTWSKRFLDSHSICMRKKGGIRICFSVSFRNLVIRLCKFLCFVSTENYSLFFNKDINHGKFIARNLLCLTHAIRFQKKGENNS